MFLYIPRFCLAGQDLCGKYSIRLSLDRPTDESRFVVCCTKRFSMQRKLLCILIGEVSATCSQVLDERFYLIVIFCNGYLADRVGCQHMSATRLFEAPV